MERVPILKLGPTLLVSIQIDLQDQTALALQDDLAERIVATGATGVLIDISAVEIVAEKDESTYRSAVAKYAIAADTTWMVGNSPKSDINPALAAGLHAVFIPHDNTWILEHEELRKAPEWQRLLVVDHFADLRQHF